VLTNNRRATFCEVTAGTQALCEEADVGIGSLSAACTFNPIANWTAANKAIVGLP